jgi:hypothetical protein
LLAQQMLSAACAAAFCSTIMNPLDIARTRIQVSGLQSKATGPGMWNFTINVLSLCFVLNVSFTLSFKTQLEHSRKHKFQTGNRGSIPRSQDPRSQRRFQFSFERSLIQFTSTQLHSCNLFELQDYCRGFAWLFQSPP